MFKIRNNKKTKREEICLRQNPIIPTFDFQTNKTEDENDMETMFDTLLQLPLFQGLVRDDFTRILEKVRLHFTKHNPGELLLKEGSSCNDLVFILKGEVSATTSSDHSSYSFTEYFQAPYLIEAYSMFGMKTYYNATYRAKTEVHTVSINKAFALKELFKYEIFRLNYMNIVCNRAQTLHNRLWTLSDNNLEARIAHFILSHTERWSGEKILTAKTETLAKAVNDTRAGVSKALYNMQEKGKIELHCEEIIIPDVEKLLK